MSPEARKSHEEFLKKIEEIKKIGAEFKDEWRRESEERCKRKIYAKSNLVQIEVVKAPPRHEGPALRFQLPSPAQMKRLHRKLAEAAERATP